MDQLVFQSYLDKYKDVIAHIQFNAHALHDSVNQKYGKCLSYGYHLDHVADAVAKYGYCVCESEDDVLPLLFGAYYHDSIEDARFTYHDVQRAARPYMREEQVTIAAEIVYALTNDKGRNRAERAGERYYAGIRTTPYAPFVKLADRYANVSFSMECNDANNVRMRGIYAKEMPHFIDALKSQSSDKRLQLPETMIQEMLAILG